MIRWAFHTYAAGGTTLSQITASLNLLGLRSSTISGKQGPGMTVSMVQRMLRHPYYRGIIVWRGVEYPGRHRPLVDPATWQRVQDCLTENRIGKGARVQHPHNLSGILKCGHCGASMVASYSRSHTGKVYPYFICNGRNNKSTSCNMRAIPIAVVEQLVGELYARITLTPAEAEHARSRLRVEKSSSYADEIEHEQTEQRVEIERQHRLILDAYYQDAIPLEMLQREHQRLRDALREIGHGLERVPPDGYKNDAHSLTDIEMRENAHTNYLEANTDQKHAMHRSLFKHVVLLRHERVSLAVEPRAAYPIPIIELDE